MGQVDITINGRSYEIACDDGQEDHVRQLGDYVDRRVQELIGTVGQVGDSRLLVMSSLLVADELSEAYAALEQRPPDSESPESQATDALAEAIETLAQRVESIAANLETA